VNATTDGDDRSVGSMGLSFDVDGDRVVAAFTPRFEHRGAPGFLHGGFAAMALDETLAAVGWLLDGQHVVTATLELRYRRPVPLSAGSAVDVPTSGTASATWSSAAVVSRCSSVLLVPVALPGAGAASPVPTCAADPPAPAASGPESESRGISPMPASSATNVTASETPAAAIRP
jgi:hypothetical protein